MDERKEKAMLKAFDVFAERIAERYAEVRQALVEGDYVKAQVILAKLGISHARTSMSLRGLLIREGLLTEDDK